MLVLRHRRSVVVTVVCIGCNGVFSGPFVSSLRQVAAPCRYRRLEAEMTVTPHNPVDLGPALVPHPRKYQVLNRSGESGTPPARGNPAACVNPALGRQSIIYMERQIGPRGGKLHELWRTDPRGHRPEQRGSINLSFGPNATPALTNPYIYADTTARQQIVLYGGTDNNVHSLYWGETGPVGHDNLTGFLGAPKTVTKPVGYFDAAANTHYVIYASDNGALHNEHYSKVGSK
jgi:hypothetical protein